MCSVLGWAVMIFLFGSGVGSMMMDVRFSIEKQWYLPTPTGVGIKDFVAQMKW